MGGTSGKNGGAAGTPMIFEIAIEPDNHCINTGQLLKSFGHNCLTQNKKLYGIMVGKKDKIRQ